jgi:hypothetical protein
MVWFRPVVGPLDPLPGPLLKPLDQAREVVLAALLARAPKPKLKPGRGGVIPVGLKSPPPSEGKPDDLEFAAGDGASTTPPPPAGAEPES